jgi:hypothetical protein
LLRRFSGREKRELPELLLFAFHGGDRWIGALLYGHGQLAPAGFRATFRSAAYRVALEMGKPEH